MVSRARAKAEDQPVPVDPVHYEATTQQVVDRDVIPDGGPAVRLKQAVRGAQKARNSYTVIDREAQDGDAVDLAHLLFDAGDVMPVLMVMPRELALTDVTEDIGSFKRTLAFAKARKLPVPGVVVGSEMVPVDMMGMLLRTGMPMEEMAKMLQPGKEKRLVRTMFDETEKMGLPVKEMRPKAAKRSFLERLGGFLGARMTYYNGRGPNDPPDPPTYRDGLLDLTVETDTPGLTVLYDPAYLVRGGTVFGAPSTPVCQGVLPGLYLLGASGRPLKRRYWQKEPVPVPPVDYIKLSV